jgi:hypothetical protein
MARHCSHRPLSKSARRAFWEPWLKLGFALYAEAEDEDEEMEALALCALALKARIAAKDGCGGPQGIYNTLRVLKMYVNLMMSFSEQCFKCWARCVISHRTFVIF